MRTGGLVRRAVPVAVAVLAIAACGALRAAELPRVVVPVPDDVRARLDAQGFATRESGATVLAALYWSWKSDHYPVLVTTDAAVHTAHLVFDWHQRFLEVAHLRGDLVNLSDALSARMMANYDAAADEADKQAALVAACYMLVGKHLMTGGDLAGVPEPWKGRIQGELDLVAAAGGLADSPLFGYKEDYSQYKPRGHYARSDELASYFRAMTWFGRMKLRLDPKSPEQTRAAILLCRALSSEQVKGEAALAVWRRIYETTAFFAGPSDDLLPTDYMPLLPRQLAADSLADFIVQARKLPRPRILGTFDASPDWRANTQGLTIFGQRYALDSEVMQRLVFDSVGAYKGGQPEPFTCVHARGSLIRGVPRGLDMMAALGNVTAEDALRRAGDDAYVGYDERLTELKSKLAAIPEADWHTDLYAMRLHVAALLNNLPEGKLPDAMHTDAWKRKQLAAALGSWTELRHDTILYTKQPYAVAQMALAGMAKAGPVGPQPPPPRGYVEPAPQVYGALAESFTALAARIKSLAYPSDPALTETLVRFAKTMQTLEALSNKELAGQALTDEEFQFIERIASSLNVPRYGFSHYWDVTEPFQAEMDNEMPIVADVHTDVNSGMALEEAVGAPLILYMVCPVDGQPTVCLGVVYSYYEFKQPMSQRLTDEEWRKMLAGNKQPARPDWVAVEPAQRVPRPSAQQKQRQQTAPQAR